ncbi:MAG: hypothetical protein IJH63_00490 [Methanobrevibacter sp.]|nr:hypothetical protein [Methanosphaera sp.]MBR0369181.1 hypothetical protein [Methanobrevibacter sp.]
MATKITFKNIQTIAKKTKAYVEKNGKLPSTLTVDNVKYTYPQIGYILAKSVNNIGKDITVISVGKAPKPQGETVKFDINEEDYKKLAKNYSNFIEDKENRKLPNYSTYNGKRIHQRVFIYSLSKIIVWYTNHNKVLPSKCRFYTSETKVSKTTTKTTTTNTTTKSSVKTKLNPYMTNSGCSGLGQCTGYFCACNSLQQCFYRLTGIKVAESTIAKWAGTTSSGTSHQGIETAVAMFNKTYKKNVKIKWYNFSDLGKNDTSRWSKFQSLITNGAMFTHILYRYNWGHYEVPKSVSGSNVIVLNSLGSSCGSGTYCGYIETRTKSTELGYMKGISQKSICALTI